MNIHLSRRPLRRPRTRRAKALTLTTLVAAALVPSMLLQANASAADVFCIGGGWSNGSGGTIGGDGYPDGLSTVLRDQAWSGAGAAGTTRMIKGDLWRQIHRIYYPQWDKQRECPNGAAAPCTVQDIVTIKDSHSKVKGWHVGGSVSGSASGSIFGIGATGNGGYNESETTTTEKEYTITNLIPYGRGKTLVPASFVDWKTRAGVIRGGYFKTGAVCRSNGEAGMQYEYRDVDLSEFFAEENVGEGSTWMFVGTPLEKWFE